jgi:non-specific serine/threonine protein kinase
MALGGQHVVSAWAATRAEYEYCLAGIHAQLTETEIHREDAAGYAYTLEQAVAYARHLLLQTTVSPAARPIPDTLTSRERQIAVLIALGKSNGEIADQCVVSKRTIEKHIAHILSKLGVANRAQIVRWAIEVGLAKSTP